MCARRADFSEAPASCIARQLVDAVAHAGESHAVLLERETHRPALDVPVDPDEVRGALLQVVVARPLGGAGSRRIPTTSGVEKLSGDVPVADAFGSGRCRACSVRSSYDAITYAFSPATASRVVPLRCREPPRVCALGGSSLSVSEKRTVLYAIGYTSRQRHQPERAWYPSGTGLLGLGRSLASIRKLVGGPGGSDVAEP